MRQIFLLILLFIVGQWLVKALRRHDAGAARRGAGGARASDAPRLAEPMIRCAECGVHAPKSDSIVVAGDTFCCAAHAKRHGARPSGRDAR